MMYVTNPAYVQKYNHELIKKIVETTVVTVGQWCTHYQATVTNPTSVFKHTLQDHSQGNRRQGRLPQNDKERMQYVQELVQWIFTNSEAYGGFELLLEKENPQTTQREEKFDHHEGEDTWVVMLSNDEFETLQESLVSAQLPKDFFIANPVKL